MTKVELYAIGTSTILASNKSLRRNQRAWAIFKAGRQPKNALAMLLRSHYPQHAQRVRVETVSEGGRVG
jgi:hypothetical protein